jgi:hypothetical protein
MLLQPVVRLPEWMFERSVAGSSEKQWPPKQPRSNPRNPAAATNERDAYAIGRFIRMGITSWLYTTNRVAPSKEADALAPERCGDRFLVLAAPLAADTTARVHTVIAAGGGFRCFSITTISTSFLANRQIRDAPVSNKN